MRFMLIVKATPESEAGTMPDDTTMAAMADYHEQLVKAGVLLDAAGLHPSRNGWRVMYDAQGGKHIVDGPFAETKELVGGYSLIEVRSREEALEWSRRFPSPSAGHACHLEVRQLIDLDDLAPGESIDRFKAMEAAGARA